MQKKEVKAAEVKATEKETVKDAPKADAKKTATKKATTKKTTTKSAASTVISVQYQNCEVEIDKIEERVKAQFVSEGHRAGSIKQLNIYVKPEDYSAYYVINGKFSGRVDLF